jgi:hypothetical protein
LPISRDIRREITARCGTTPLCGVTRPPLLGREAAAFCKSRPELDWSRLRARLKLVVVRRALLPVILAIPLAGFATASASIPPGKITQTQIGKAPLGLTRAQYTHLFGKPAYVTRYGHGMVRLVFANKELAVYLSAKGKGIAVLTSAEEYRTAKRVGPCSPVATLKRAYKGRLVKMRRAGHTVAYRLNRLVFAAPAGKVGAVMLAGRSFSVTVAVNAGQCGGGEED